MFVFVVVVIFVLSFILLILFILNFFLGVNCFIFTAIIHLLVINK